MLISVFKMMLKIWSKIYYFTCRVSFLGEYINKERCECYIVYVLYDSWCELNHLPYIQIYLPTFLVGVCRPTISDNILYSNKTI